MSLEHLLKRYFSIDHNEKKNIMITTGVFTIITFFFFAKIVLGTQKITSQAILKNLIATAFFSLLSILILISVSKVVAIQRGCKANYKMWLNGLLISLVISFLSAGFVPVLFPGIIEIKTIRRLRHGGVFYGENRGDILASLITPLGVLLIISLFMQILYESTQVQFFYYGMIIPALIVFFSMLPFNNNFGLFIFRLRKDIYFLLFIFSFFFAILMIINISYGIFIAIGLFLITWLLIRKYISKTFYV